MGAFELPLLIIAWFVAICLIAPVILAVLVFIVGVVCSLVIKYTDDSNNLLDIVKPPKPVGEVKHNSNAYSGTKDKRRSGFNAVEIKNAHLDAICTRKIKGYIKGKYPDKYPTVKNFEVINDLVNDVLILKDKDGNILGKEEIDPMVLLDLKKAAMQEYEQKHNYLTT